MKIPKHEQTCQLNCYKKYCQFFCVYSVVLEARFGKAWVLQTIETSLV